MTPSENWGDEESEEVEAGAEWNRGCPELIYWEGSFSRTRSSAQPWTS